MTGLWYSRGFINRWANLTSLSPCACLVHQMDGYWYDWYVWKAQDM